MIFRTYTIVLYSTVLRREQFLHFSRALINLSNVDSTTSLSTGSITITFSAWHGCGHLLPSIVSIADSLRRYASQCSWTDNIGTDWNTSLTVCGWTPDTLHREGRRCLWCRLNHRVPWQFLSFNVISDKHAGEAMDNMRFGLEEAMCLSCCQGVVSARRPVDTTMVSCGQYTKLT